MLRTFLPFHKGSILCPISILKNSSSFRFNSSDKYYDIIIVGGGLIGATLACTLGKNSRLSDKRILLLEANKKQEWKLTKDYSNVVTALNPSTFKLLNEIGAWKHIKSNRFGTVTGMQVWEANSEAMIKFQGDNSNDNISYIVENNVVLNGVWKELEKLDNVEVLHEAGIDCYKLGDKQENNELTLKNGSIYSSDLLLGCDGWRSQVRQKMGVHFLSWNYNQMGIVATLELEEECDNTIAWQRFLPNGTIALLPLNNKASSLVWSTTSDNAKELLSLTDQEFVENLNDSMCMTPKKNFIVEESTKAFDHLMNILNLASTKERQLPPRIIKCQEKSRAAFPLGFGHSTNYVMKRVALVGDAAHKVHPLAGQGANLGFGDITCLNEVLGAAAYSGSELGSLLYLKEYETRRQRRNIPTMLAIEGLYRLYGTDFPPAVLLRSIGLQAVNAAQPIKGLIRSFAAS